jgi:hypothetical protein
MPPFGVEDFSDRGLGMTRRVQRSDPLHPLRIIAELVQAGDRPDQAHPSPVPSHPVDLDLDLFRLALHGHDDALDELAEDRLAVGRRGSGRVPQRGDVRREPANRRALLGAQDRRLGGEKAGMLGLKALLFG